ncbi:hypothetical protein Tco_0092656 [Tanacetum coccineum]
MENLEFCDKHNIVNWEYILLGMTEAKDSEVCKITRADGSSSFHGDIQALLRRLDRQDLSQLYSLVQERFKDHPLEGHDLDLWGDLRMIFDPWFSKKLNRSALSSTKLNIDRWSLDELVYGAPSEGPYQTNLPFPDDIISYVREDREGGNQDHVPACLCYMLYCVANSEKFNLAYWNGYLRKGRKTKPKRQNRTRNGKAGKDKVKI